MENTQKGRFFVNQQGFTYFSATGEEDRPVGASEEGEDIVTGTEV